MKTPSSVLARAVTRFRLPIVVFWIVLAFGGLAFATRMRIDNDVLNWVEQDGPLGALPNYLNERFGQTNPVVVLVIPDKPWSTEGLGLLREITERTASRPDSETALSLANVTSIEGDGTSIGTGTFIPSPVPVSEDELARLRSLATGDPSFAERLVSRDGGTFALVVKPAMDERVDDVASSIRSDLETWAQGRPVRLVFAGVPSLMTEVSKIVASDLALLVPAVLVLVASVIIAHFRSFSLAVPTLAATVAPVAIALGFHAAAGGSLNAMSVAIPVILIAVASAYGIHVTQDRLEHLPEDAGRDESERVAEGYRRVGLPVLLSGLTTAGGFASLGGADISVVRDFGYLCAAGTIASIACSLTLVPALLGLARGRSLSRSEPAFRGPGRLATGLASLVSRRAPAMVACFALAFAGLALFASKVESRVDYLSYFDPDSEPRKAAAEISRSFGGYSPAQIYAKGDMTSPLALKALQVADAIADAWPGTPPASGYPETIARLNGAVTGIDAIPETTEELAALSWLVEGRSELRSFVSDSREEALSTFMIPTLDTRYYKGLEAAISEWTSSFPHGAVPKPASFDDPGFVRVAGIFARLALDRADSPATDGDSPEARPIIDADVAAILEAVANVDTSLAVALPRGFISAYLSSDESEAPMAPDEALAAERACVARDATGTEVFAACIEEALGDRASIDPDEVLAAAATLEARRSEAVARLKISAATEALERVVPGGANRETAYALSALSWSSYPARAEADDPDAVPLEMEFTGLSTLMDGMRESLLGGQVAAIAIAAAIVAFLNAVALRSLAKGSLTLVPLAFTVAFVFGVMGAFGIALDMITIAIASIAIGTGVDFAIHFVSRLARERREGRSTESALAFALSGEGRAIVGNALSVGSGFAVLAFSRVMPLKTLGLMLALTMAVAAISACILAPAFSIAVSSLGRRTRALFARLSGQGTRESANRISNTQGARTASGEESS